MIYVQRILKGNSDQKRGINNEIDVLMCAKDYFLANVAILSLYVDAHTDLEECSCFFF